MPVTTGCSPEAAARSPATSGEPVYLVVIDEYAYFSATIGDKNAASRIRRAVPRPGSPRPRRRGHRHPGHPAAVPPGDRPVHAGPVRLPAGRSAAPPIPAPMSCSATAGPTKATPPLTSTRSPEASAGCCPKPASPVGSRPPTSPITTSPTSRLRRSAPRPEGSGMTAIDDYYDLLGVTSDRDPDRDQEGLPRLARQHHPDMNNGDPDAAARFKLITEAYEVLSDPRPSARTTTAPTRPRQAPSSPHPVPTAWRSAGVLRVLEDTWQAIRARHPQIPAVVIIIASGTDGKQARFGHHAPERWHVGQDERTEIMISGEGLAPRRSQRPRHAAARGRARPGRRSRHPGHQPPGPLPQQEIQGPRRGARHHRRARPEDRLVPHHRPRRHRHSVRTAARGLADRHDAVADRRAQPGRNDPAQHQPDRRSVPLRAVHPRRRLHPRRRARDLRGLRRRLHPEGQLLTLNRQTREDT